MQTIQKRKQWALIALALIATLTLQLFAPITAYAEETSESEIRSLTFKTSTTIYSEKLNTSYFTEYSYEVVGEGYFSVKCFSVEDADTTQFMATGYVCSDKPFSWRNQYNSTEWTGFVDASARNGIYYMPLLFGGSYASDWEYTWAGLVNNTHYTSKTEYNEAVETFFETMEVTKDDYKELVFDESTATYNSDIPTPKLTVNNDYSFGFNNASDDYYVQIKGRWYSVDDIELYKENLQWKYKYNSILKGSLSDWVSPQGNISVSSNSLNFASFGQSAFNSFLSTYPIDSRSYSGGTNALGNYFSGYNDALSTFKMLLGQPTSIYNGLEVYVRYYTFDSNDNAIYGKWCHYYDNLASSSGSSGSQWDDSENMFMGNQSENGLDDDQFTTVENMTDSRNDIDLVPEYNKSGFESIVLGNVDTTSLVSTLESMHTQTSSFINMIGTVFNFLPSWVTAMICASLGLVCVIGIWKCIKG